MNKMYEYLLNHNYISNNKISDKQQELSSERAECIANKCDSLFKEEKENIIKYLVKEIEEHSFKALEYNHEGEFDWQIYEEYTVEVYQDILVRLKSGKYE